MEFKFLMEGNQNENKALLKVLSYWNLNDLQNQELQDSYGLKVLSYWNLNDILRNDKQYKVVS